MVKKKTDSEAASTSRASRRRETPVGNEAEAEQARQDAVDLLEEEREMALIRSTIYQQDLRGFHARNVRGRAFQEGDLVL